MQQASFLDDAKVAERKGEYVLPPGSTVESCRSCGAQIVWDRTRDGKAIPLSLATVQHRFGVAYALPHFVDCPDAKDWSKR